MLTSLVTNQERLVNTTTYADQLQPAVTVLDDGTQVVVWASNGQDGSGYGVYAQRLDANGQPLGGEFRVNSVTSLNQQNPSVTPLGNGGFMVFWEHNYTGNNAIRAQRYDADGTPVGSEMTMAAQSNGNVRATRLSDGSVMAVWTHAESNLTAIHGQRFDADGNAQTGVFALATIGKYAVNGASLPSIAALEGGGYAISYAYSINGLNRHWDVYTQVYAANNAAVTGEILSSSISGDYNQRQSVLAGLADGGYVVVYMGDGDSDSSENGVFLRRYSATGQLLQGDTLVNSYVTGDQQQPSVTALADGGFMVAWTSAAQDGSGYGVYAQRYNASGGKVGGDFLLEQVAAGDQVQPALASRPDGGFVATWAGQDASGYGIRVREFPVNAEEPVFTAQNLLFTRNEVKQASSLLLPSHAQGDAWATSGLQGITQYEFIDTNTAADSGHFILNGVEQVAKQTIAVTAEQLKGLNFVGGTASVSDSILVRVSDGTRWSDWNISTATTLLPATSLTASPEAPVNKTVSGNQLQPAVTILDDGTQVVAWAADGQDGSGYGVYAQRLDANGQPLGGEFRVNSVTSLNQQNPSVTPLGNGGFMVFWEHNYTGNNAIRAQRYDADGTPVGSEMTMAAQSNGNVRATRLSDGSVMAVWTHAESNLTAIHGQRFDADGNAQTGVFALATIGKYAVNGASLPSIAALEGGGYAISYAYSINGLNRHWDVYTQVYAANNAAVTGEILSSSISGDYNQRQSVLAGLADGGYVVVYMGDGDSDSSENGVFLRRYSATGQLLQGDTLVNSYVTGDQQQPSVTALADGGFVVAWTSAAQDGSGYGVYAQRYNANGGKVGGDFLLEQVAAGDQVQPALAARPDGGFVATWAGQDASGYGIRVREYAANGTVPPTYTTLTGTDGNDTLTAATSAPHRLYGLGGNDSLTGGASGDLLFGGDGDDTINGLDGNDQLLGGNGNDRLYGGDGNDTLDGGAGNNALYGGDGNDVYLVNGTGDAVREFAGEGIDEVQTTLAGYTLGANVERLVFVGSGAFSGTGNALDNLIVGGSGNDTLTGGDGADTLIGGNGDDRLYFDAADAPVQGGNGFDTAVVQGSLGASLNLAASSIEQAYGGTGNDTLNGAGALSGLYINGRDGNDVITGSGFNDTLIGGNGIDTLVGGDGDDLLYVGDAASAVNGGAGIDTLYVQANGNLTLDLAATGIERVFSGGGNDSVTAAAALVGVEINGGAGDDSLIGSAFNDTLRGDAGDDTLAGGDGNDTLVGGGGTDALFGGGGDDRLYVDSWTATVDGGSGDDIVYIRTTDGSLLDVSASIEHVHGGSGNDMIIAANAQSGVEMLGGAGNDWLAGGIYADSLRGDDGRDYLFGGAGDDTLQSGNGDDMLAGSVGDDYLVGGNGADLFLWSVGDGNDLIRDFNASQGDRISLAADTTYTVGSNARGDAVLTFASSETLTLYGVRSSDVAGGWFVTV